MQAIADPTSGVMRLAIVGPGRLARGDEQTVAAQRAAVAERTPELLPVFDALTPATRELAGSHAR
ncbi:MAG: hypothetical protein KGL16_11190 [Acidobacteriota bacterium]|nr:hypothetical protein [Acidobacteriota bacterium]